MVKTRLQASASNYSGPIDCFRKIISTEGGPRALYRGLTANLIGVSPEKAIKLVSILFFPVDLCIFAYRQLHIVIQNFNNNNNNILNRLQMNISESSLKRKTVQLLCITKF